MKLLLVAIQFRPALLERKYAIKVLRRKPPGNAVRGIASAYTGEAIAVPQGLWLASWKNHHGRLEELQRKRRIASSPMAW
ncbi:hypothetical protein WJU23_02605 [Prosthecobacter sp. SYSU 5D2]|uniref:hypothetical protein n=1 Tax=Prosthecobacter sp. SYSU 5D2 TaxID=3134134 RepID=UPI0031FEA9EC